METGQVLLILPNGSGGSIRSPTRGQESSAEIPVTDRVASIEFEMPRSLKDHKLGLGPICLAMPAASSCVASRSDPPARIKTGRFLGTPTLACKGEIRSISSMTSGAVTD